MHACMSLQSLMKEAGVAAALTRSTDLYLNEYVPELESLRLFITGFKGSVGDAIVLQMRPIYL